MHEVLHTAPILPPTPFPRRYCWMWRIQKGVMKAIVVKKCSSGKYRVLENHRKYQMLKEKGGRMAVNAPEITWEIAAHQGLQQEWRSSQWTWQRKPNTACPRQLTKPMPDEIQKSRHPNSQREHHPQISILDTLFNTVVFVQAYLVAGGHDDPWNDSWISVRCLTPGFSCVPVVNARAQHTSDVGLQRSVHRFSWSVSR